MKELNTWGYDELFELLEKAVPHQAHCAFCGTTYRIDLFQVQNVLNRKGEEDPEATAKWSLEGLVRRPESKRDFEFEP